MRNNLTQFHNIISHNTEKVIYFLLLERKRRRPALEDDEETARTRNDVVETIDPPKKRLDTCRINGQSSLSFGQISEGSPLTPRRQAFKYVHSTLFQICILEHNFAFHYQNIDHQTMKKNNLNPTIPH